MLKRFLPLLTLIFFAHPSCREKNAGPSEESINELNLKRGEMISCGPPDKEFGSVVFETSCAAAAPDFNLAMELLHSFEYDEAEKVFARIIDKRHDCAMAYWGIAMSNFHPLWSPPSEPELVKGAKAINIAQSIPQKTKREAAYIDAIASFYKDWEKADHHTRCLRFEKGMEKLQSAYPEDKEAAIFYALALDAAADPADKSLSRQKKAGSILTALYAREPNHPGIIHYIIHTFDFPALAALALPAARKYASVAPSSAHALHMPSHIFTRLGLWDECIRSNLASISSARCYAESAGIKGHWDEELHGMDYLVYAYLQKGANGLAKEQCDSLRSFDEVYPSNFKVAYSFASIPSRYVLENRLWDQAARLTFHPARFPWKDHPWESAIIHFTRLLGDVHIGRPDSANSELTELNKIHDQLMAQKDGYKANQVQIQINASEAWIRFKAGDKTAASKLMNLAADMEDATQKHPVTPCEVLPARELLGDLLLEMNSPREALQAYQEDLKNHPNRFNGLYGAGLAAERSGSPELARSYYQQLVDMAGSSKPGRPEIDQARRFLANGSHPNK
ncbi:MAG: tetratricopeptide repeat protein [Bacteroidota bacterium]|nr:tetratricopeptide repeat protein [Bacteroidota bacterium]MDP4217039.1 tetratricopeptide repeat protein [Bacteroidota bacterium]MDP4252508.1 tetratricopeptide repeat protein [Bacteroidota bacterium]